jgi:predicted nucleic acid-binding protein
MKISGSFIDTDIIVKLGTYSNGEHLIKVLKSFGYNLYLHEYLMQEELIFGEGTLRILNEMITLNDVVVMKESDLSDSEFQEYNSALQLLANEMNVDLSKKRDRNAGEVKSMAMAFAKDFEYFISDDGEARMAAKKYLQKIDGSHLNTIRMKDIIIHIKQNTTSLNIDRKTAKNLYLFGTSPKLANTPAEAKKLETIREILKKEFESTLWPLDN